MTLVVIRRAAEGGYFDDEIETLMYAPDGEDVWCPALEEAMLAVGRRALALCPDVDAAEAYEVVVDVGLPQWRNSTQWEREFDRLVKLFAERGL